MTDPRYATPAAFKQALEQRLRNASSSGADVVRRRQLDFAGIEPPRFRLYPIVSHIAEKLHAYSMPRERPNSRIKDLPDLALLASAGEIDGAVLRTALETTFEFRGTHALPDAVPESPVAWRAPYEVMAATDELPSGTLGEGHGAVAAFLDPVLSGRAGRGRWVSSEWRWRNE